ncbi:catechol 2,3-dioxygenase-like lactoylglutathione lyase family enzyme [Paenibacillus phyllosphaerae]|uniref:Catechol 2,3-dioxygenase-like lactoylglutathione lyase family enzyme n=1 Tax=Paenibacillus phyllosphaerae TaxID=274593 RepID=A0A7W5B6U2_9BACL|nr:VOC family protein [Paenibacillus phyllosphaerae]MBB3114801.1 catechol 2,3-dioxygenase-like lactoylglutathione lyase family enzyme [Paenibacillus phyllosphaerae]
MSNFISHVQIPVKNLDEAINWYTTYLDCRLHANFGDFSIISFAEDETHIFLWQTSDETNSTFSVNGEPFPAIGFQVNDMDELCKKVSEGGLMVHGDPHATPVEEGRRFLKFFDLDGNMLVAHTA